MLDRPKQQNLAVQARTLRPAKFHQAHDTTGVLDMPACTTAAFAGKVRAAPGAYGCMQTSPPPSGCSRFAARTYACALSHSPRSRHAAADSVVTCNICQARRVPRAALGGRIRYLVDTPEMIWGCLDTGRLLDGARRLLRAREVHRRLRAGRQGAEVAARFPLLVPLWPGVEKFRCAAVPGREATLRSGIARKST